MNISKIRPKNPKFLQQLCQNKIIENLLQWVYSYEENHLFCCVNAVEFILEYFLPQFLCANIVKEFVFIIQHDNVCVCCSNSTKYTSINEWMQSPICFFMHKLNKIMECDSSDDDEKARILRNEYKKKVKKIRNTSTDEGYKEEKTLRQKVKNKKLKLFI